MNTLLQSTTHIAKVRQHSLTTAQKICQLLGWTFDQYCQHQYEQYELFINKMFEGFPVMCAEVRHSAVFRGFWNNEWLTRNEQDFIPFTDSVMTDELAVTVTGELIVEMGLPAGDAYLVDEYLFINNHMALMNCDYFMNKYNNVMRLI